MSASYNDWESDLSSIIEKTNQNLKLLRRIGEKRTDDVSTTRPSSMSMGNASDLRTAVHHRYAAEDAAAYRPRVMSSASSNGRKHASIMGDPRLGSGSAGGGGLRAFTMLESRRGEANYDSDDLHSTSRMLRRAASRTDGSKTLKPTSTTPIRVHEADMPSDIPNYVLDEIKKSLEVSISSRSSVFEKRIGDLRTDFTVLTNETTQLSHKFAELRDSVTAKMSNVPGVLQSLQENTDAITRLEKHSSALLGWKVSMDQDFFEIASKVKSFASVQDKMGTLESNLESLATALRNRPRHDEKVEELRDKLATVERHQSSFVDMKAVENLLNIRLPREFHDLDGRMNQSIAFVSEKVEAKIQNLEKSLQSQRADSMASLKSELVEDIQRLSATSLRKTDIVPLQNVQAQLKEDLSQLNGFLERHDKRIQDSKQSSTQIREELLETKQELTKALHVQQGRVAATLEEKIAQLSIMSKERNVKVDQQMAILSKKQKKAEENTKTLHEDVAKVQQDVLYKQNATHVAQQKENENLRQRLARSVAELETLTVAKVELERRCGRQEKQLQAKLKSLHAKLEESEKLKEFERLELIQKIQEETKLMGIAQGKNALLEALLAKEKLQSAEKNDLVHKSRQEMNLVRQKMRSFEAEVELRMHKLATELHSKQIQVDTLVKKLKKSEEEAAKLLESTKRDAKSFRRGKVTKEHELSIAKLRLKEMEEAMVISQPNGVKEESKQAPDARKKSVEEAEAKRKEMEQLLLESQLQVDELNQEIVEMRKEHGAAKKQQRTSLEEHISKLSSDYEVKIVALNAAVVAKDQAMSRLRDSLVEKSELDAVDEQLRALKDEKKSLLATIELSHSEQTRVIQEHEAKAQLVRDKEMDAMKQSMETRMEEIEEARAGLERFKSSISELEDQLKDQESSHAEELASLLDEIKEARASIAACTAEVEELRLGKSQLEHELESVQSELENLRSEAEGRDAEMDEKLAEQETETQSKLDELSGQLEGKERELAVSKQTGESNRRRLSEMVSEQEQMEHLLRTEIASLSLALGHERENSKAREQESESAILGLQSELAVIKLDSEVAKTSYQSTVVAEIAEVTSSLKESQRREQQLQERLVSILKEVAQASSTFNADTQVDITGSEDDDELAVTYLGHFCATQRGTILELENLQTDYEMAVKQVAEDAVAIQDLDAQVKGYSTQIQDLQAVVKQLEGQLKGQYATSAKQSEDLEQEIAALKRQRSDLERIVESKSSEFGEKQALFDRQLDSKQDQVELLRQENEKVSSTIESIRAKMESIEASKARELDEMSTALTELEAQAAKHSVKAQGGAVSELDKDFFASHRETLALAQSIRSLQLRLTKSVGMLEWNDLKASVFEEEDKLERLRKEKSREVTKLGSAEDEILLNADFLKAVLSLRESDESDASEDWISKYVQTAPEMVEKLRSLESRLQETMAKHHAHTSATESTLSSRTMTSEPVQSANPDLQEHECSEDGSADGKRCAQGDFEDEEEEDHDIDSEEELEESRDEEPSSEHGERAGTHEPHTVLGDNSKSTSEFDEHDDFEEQSEGDESAEVEDRSHELARADFDSRMKSAKRSDDTKNSEQEGSDDEVSSAGCTQPPRQGRLQKASDDEHDQGFHRVDVEHDSDMEGEDAKASASELRPAKQGDFEGIARDPNLRDASFDSHESGEENLSEFENLRRSQPVSCAESSSLSVVTGSFSHEGDDEYAMSRPTYRMEEEESDEEDDMDDVERMLLAESLDTDQHIQLRRFGEEGQHSDSTDEEEQLGGSAEIERPDMTESSFDEDLNAPPSRSPPRGEDLDLEQDTHESLTRDISAHGSMQSGADKTLRDDNHRDHSRAIDDDEGLMDASLEDKAIALGSGKLVEGDLNRAPSNMDGPGVQHTLDDSCEDDRGDIKTSELKGDASRADEVIKHGFDSRVGEGTAEEHDESGNEESVDGDDENVAKRSFEQVPSASTIDSDDQKEPHGIADDSSVPPAVSSSLSGGSALLTHMSFSRSQIDDDELDEVEQLMRERSGFASQRPNALASGASSHETNRHQEEDGDAEKEDGDALIDSESDDDDDEEDSCDGGGGDERASSGRQREAESRSQGFSPDEDLYAISRNETSFGSKGIARAADVRHDQRLDESHEDSEDDHEESPGASQEQFSRDPTPARTVADSESMESSFDGQTLRTVDRAAQYHHEGSRRRFHDGGVISDSSESDDDEKVSSQLHSRVHEHTLAPLGSGSKSLGFGLSRRGALEEDDDGMDEVERLLLEQTSMKQQHQQMSKQASQSVSSRQDASESDDDGFGEESIGALMEERDHLQHSRTQASGSLKPLDIAGRTQQQQQDRPTGFAHDDDDGDIDNDSDREKPSPLRTDSFSNRGDFNQSDSASSSPSASSTRIPIFIGSNLADRVATDAIPSMLSQQTATATAVESEIEQQRQHLEHDDDIGEEDGDEEGEYLEESFDLEESLQEEEEED